MIRKLTVIIASGETTCFDLKTDKMCPYVLTSHMGTRWHCQLFSKYNSGKNGHESLAEKDDMLQRHPDCLIAEAHSKRIQKRSNKDHDKAQ